MLYRQCRQVSIRDKIGLGLAFIEHYLKYLPVTLCRMNQPHAWLVNPALDSLYGLLRS